MQPITKLPRCLNLIVLCWNNAESKVCSLVEKKYWVHDEVFVTRLLYGDELDAKKWTRVKLHSID